MNCQYKYIYHYCVLYICVNFLNLIELKINIKAIIIYFNQISCMNKLQLLKNYIKFYYVINLDMNIQKFNFNSM